MIVHELPRFLPRNFQLDVLDGIFHRGEKRQAISVARRGGKDYIAFAVADAIANMYPGLNVGYLGVSLKSLKKILMSNDGEAQPMYKSIMDCKNTLIATRSKDYFHKEMGAFRYKNGSLLYLLGTDQSAELGTSIDVLIITESARIAFESWKFLIPSIEGRDGIIIQVSTPFFGSEFNDLLEGEHRYSKSYAKYVIPADKLLNSDGTRVYSDEKLKKISEEMDKASFEQDYMCNTKAINSTSIMGYSLEKAILTGRPNLSDIEAVNRASNIRLTCVFDIGQSDSTSVMFGLEQGSLPPVLIGQMTQNKTNLSQFADEIKRLRLELSIPEDCVDIVLPFDSDHELQGYGGKINRYQEFKDNMSGYNVHLLARADKMRGIQVTRRVLETGKLRLEGYQGELTNPVRDLVKIVASVEYKVEKTTGRIQYVIDKRSGVYGDHPLDALRYFVTWKFKELFYENRDKISNYQENIYHENRAFPSEPAGGEFDNLWR